MTTRNLTRLVAGVVITVGAYALLGASGLWGVALAAPVLCLAPSAVKQAVVERRTKRALDAELRVILGGTRDQR